MTKRSVTGYRDYRALIERHFAHEGARGIVYTHKPLVNVTEYLNNFRPAKTEFITYRPALLQSVNLLFPSYFVINDYYNDNYPDALKNALEDFRLKGFEVELVDRRGMIRVYRLRMWE